MHHQSLSSSSVAAHQSIRQIQLQPPPPGALTSSATPSCTRSFRFSANRGHAPHPTLFKEAQVGAFPMKLGYPFPATRAWYFGGCGAYYGQPYFEEKPHQLESAHGKDCNSQAWLWNDPVHAAAAEPNFPDLGTQVP